MEHAYEIIPPAGMAGGLIAPASCRYSRETELSLLEAGYTIRLHGKRITKTDLRKEVVIERKHHVHPGHRADGH